MAESTTATADGQTTTTAADDKGTTTDASTTTDTTKDATGATTPAADPPASNAPAAYDLKVPESAAGRFSDEDLTYLKGIAKASDWTNKEAQEELEAAVARSDARLKSMRDKFLADTTADRQYGGDNLAQSQSLVNAVISRIRPEGHPRRDSFLRFLQDNGANNHIEVVSFLADLGKLMAEDAPGQQAPLLNAAPKSLEEKMYGAARGLRHAKE